MLLTPFFKIAKEISGSEPTTVWIASAKQTWCQPFSPTHSAKRFGSSETQETSGYKSLGPWSGFTGGALIAVIRFPTTELSLRIGTPLARFGGLAITLSIAITEEITPPLRYRRRSRNLTYMPGFRQRRMAPVHSGWLPYERVCSIGKRKFGISSMPRRNSQS